MDILFVDLWLGRVTIMWFTVLFCLTGFIGPQLTVFYEGLIRKKRQPVISCKARVQTCPGGQFSRCKLHPLGLGGGYSGIIRKLRRLDDY